MVSKDNWKSRYEAKNAPKKKTAKAEPKLSKTKFIKKLREQNPSISDREIKKALKAAGYPTGCVVAALFLLSLPVGGLVWGAVEVLW